MDFRAFARRAASDQHGEAYIEHGPASEGVFEPPSCSYCGGTEFEPQIDNGRVQRAECTACGGTMVSHGGQWMPDLIGQPDNHPSDQADPASGGVGGIGNTNPKVPQVRREEDLNSRTAMPGKVAPPADLHFDHIHFQPGSDHYDEAEESHPGWEHHILRAHRSEGDHPGQAGIIYYSKTPEGAEHPGIGIHDMRTNVNHRGQGVASAMQDELRRLHPEHMIDHGSRTPAGQRWWDQYSDPGDPKLDLDHPDNVHKWKQYRPTQLAEDLAQKDLSHLGAVDWCRHRRNEHCWLPRHDPQQGVALYVPQDRGVCPWTTASMQQINCPVSEPGPMAGMTRAGNSSAEADPNGRARIAVWTEPEWRFHVLATWADVRAKAKRIRTEGGVSIVSTLADGITGHVHGDTGVYESQINYVPGTFKIGFWQCGCAWASYAWGRSPAYRRFEGRMCSHALALQYEAQSRGMFGRTVTEDTQRPGWMRDKVRVRHDRDTRDHDVRAASRQDNLDPDGFLPSDHGLDLARSPIHAFAIEAFRANGDPADVLRVFLAAGIEHGDARRLLDATLHERASLGVQVQNLVDLGAGLELTAAKDEEPSEPTHAGVVLKAADTGRILMIQRSHQDETDPCAGTWEFPGGGREDGDHTSLHSGIREFEEEVGHEFPTGGHVSHVWQSPNGVYQGHVVVVPHEKVIDFSGGRRTVNPDDPDGDDHEQSAWWDPDHARKNPALRPECKSSPWDKIKTATLSATADYASHDTLGDLQPDWRPKAPPKAPEPGQPENPGSTGFATSQDPPEWENASQRSETMSLQFDGGFAGPEDFARRVMEHYHALQGGREPQTDAETMPYGYDDLTEFREDRKHGELRQEPEAALPVTTADDEPLTNAQDHVDSPAERFVSQMSSEIPATESLQPSDGRTASVDEIVARFQATAGAKVLQTSGGNDMNIAEAARAHLAGSGGIQRTALKDFSATERHELITEGQGQLARNFGDLKIEGTHYEALGEAIARETSLDPDDLFD